MVFAAGLGERLKPLTDRLPKALVEVGGTTMLERTCRRLVAAGADRLIVNVCPFADEIDRFVRERRGFGAEVVLSREEGKPLETGGGLAHARALFRRDGPFLLHNVDVLTDLDLGALLAAHEASGALATLAVMERESARRLLFDDAGLLGRVDASKGLDLRARPPVGRVRELAFAGVHAASPALLDLVTERGAFSILDAYLRLAGEGRRILAHRVDGCAWVDVGRPEHLEAARRLASRLR
jgi:NDP-sugar pyrophosphorylase family protein